MTTAAEENALNSEEEAQAYRSQVIADMEAEDRGETTSEAQPLPDSSASDAAKDDDAAAAAASEIVDDDPWAGVNPALKTKFDEMSETIAGYPERVKQLEKRVGSLTNELSAAKTAAAELADAPSKAQMAEAAKTTEKWDALKTDFPDWAEAIEDFVTANVGSGGGVTKKDLDDLRESMAGENQEKIEEAVITYAYPDWEETIASEAYGTWLKDQTDDIKVLTKSSHAVDAIKVLDAYGESRGKKPLTAAQIAAQRRERLQVSVIEPGRSATSPKAESDMTDAELRKKIGDEIFNEE